MRLRIQRGHKPPSSSREQPGSSLACRCLSPARLDVTRGSFSTRTSWTAQVGEVLPCLSLGTQPACLHVPPLLRTVTHAKQRSPARAGPTAAELGGGHLTAGGTTDWAGSFCSREARGDAGLAQATASWTSAWLPPPSSRLLWLDDGTLRSDGRGSEPRHSPHQLHVLGQIISAFEAVSLVTECRWYHLSARTQCRR